MRTTHNTAVRNCTSTLKGVQVRLIPARARLESAQKLVAELESKEQACVIWLERFAPETAAALRPAPPPKSYSFDDAPEPPVHKPSGRAVTDVDRKRWESFAERGIWPTRAQLMAHMDAERDGRLFDYTFQEYAPNQDADLKRYEHDVREEWRQVVAA